MYLYINKLVMSLKSKNNYDTDINDDIKYYDNELNYDDSSDDEYNSYKDNNDDNNSDNSNINDSSEVNNFNVPDTNNYDSKYNSNNNDSSNDNDNDDDDIESKANEYTQKIINERVVKYIKLDDMIKKKKKEFNSEIKQIEILKEQVQSFLIKYLDDNNDEEITINSNKGTEKVVKEVKETKGAINRDIIIEGLIDGFKKHDLYDDEKEEEVQETIKDLYNIIDSKREVKRKENIKRVREKKPKKTKTKENKKSSKKSSKKIKDKK